MPRRLLRPKRATGRAAVRRRRTAVSSLLQPHAMMSPDEPTYAYFQTGETQFAISSGSGPFETTEAAFETQGARCRTAAKTTGSWHPRAKPAMRRSMSRCSTQVPIRSATGASHRGRQTKL